VQRGDRGRSVRQRIGQTGLFQNLGQDEVDDLGGGDVGESGQALDRLANRLAEPDGAVVERADLSWHRAILPMTIAHRVPARDVGRAAWNAPDSLSLSI
jgi:hypothetical protein